MTNRGETGGGSEGAQDRPLSRDWRVQRDEVEKQLGRIARADVVTVTIGKKLAISAAGAAGIFVILFFAVPAS